MALKRLWAVPVASLLLLAACGSPAVAAPPFVFEDNEFLDSDWEVVTPFFQNGSSATAARRPSGGYPGAYRHMVHTLPGPSYLRQRHFPLGNAGRYDPSMQGAIAGISFSEDRIVIDPPFGGAGIGALFLIEQEGRYHYALTDVSFSNTTWTHRSLPCLKPSNFAMIGGKLPDFSGTGKSMRFGYFRDNTRNSVSDTPIDATHGIDNFRVVVFPEPNPDCTGGPPELTSGKTDSGHSWGDDPLIPYVIEVSNVGGTTADATLVETVPEKTTFSAAASNPGWQCTPDGSPEASVRWPSATFGAGQSQSVDFGVVVDDGTSQLWDVYNQVALTTGSGGAPIASASSPREAVASLAITSNDITDFGLCGPLNSIDAIACCIWCVFAPNACCQLMADLTDEECGNAATQGADARALVATEEVPPRTDGLLLYRLRDRILGDTRGGLRAVDLYYEHSVAISTAGLQNAVLILTGLTNLADWEQNVRALVAGEGATAIVTKEQIDGLNAFLDDLREVAEGDLASAIDRERPRLKLDEWVGLSMDDALERFNRLTCEGYEDELFCGELNGDCKVTATDALSGLQMAVGSRDVDPAADLDASGAVVASDALKILRISVGLEPQTTACNG